MKKQICFAGFAAGELETLQPFVESVSAWECVFAPDAASALAMLNSRPFDAIVTNLQSGGMNDSELLQSLASEHPRTMRFVLGDVADRELIVHCMGAAHQFISRPWKPKEIITIVEGTLGLDAWLSNDKLRSFIPRLGKLPGLPASYFEVLKKAESPHATIESIAEIISRDPSLTARLLQMVNSPACGLAEKTTNPAEAVTMLGVDAVKSIVLCLQLFARSAPMKVSGLSLEQLWAHSFHVAKLSAKIVLRCIGSERMAGEAYTAGLLHNIGQIVLATNLSGEYSAVVETARKLKCPLHEAEMQLLGVTSNQIGAYLLGLWGMPLSLLESTALYLTPSASSSVEFSLLTAVHVANVLSSEAADRGQGFPPPKLDSKYLGTLDLPKKTDAWRKFMTSLPQQELSEQATAEHHATHAGTAPVKPNRSTRLPLAIAGFAVVAVLALVIFKGQTQPTAQKATPAKAIGSSADPHQENETNRTEPMKTGDDNSAFDGIKVQGIVYSSSHPLALISGKTLAIGERINGVQVVSIDRTSVILACNGTQRTFKLK